MFCFCSCFPDVPCRLLTSERYRCHRARVVATLSELERLHATGAGAKERTRSAAGILESSRVSDGTEETATMTDDLLAVARSLVTDRTCLIISAWVCVAALVLAAALIRVSRKLFVFVTCFDIAFSPGLQTYNTGQDA